MSGAFRPISLLEDGSGKLRPTGTAFVLASGNRRVFVTAEHVVEGHELKYVGLSPEGGVYWPKKYWKLVPLIQDLPPADVAWATTNLAPDASPDLAAALPLDLARPEFRLDEGSSLVAIGYPASRAKVKQAHSVIATELMSVVGEAAPPNTYSELALDPRVHLAVTYRKDGLVDASGSRIVGAHPKGMSGGGLFVVTYGQPRDRPLLVVLFLAGVLIRFHSAPHNVMVATRIECLLDGLDVPRSGAPVRYRRVDA